PGSPGSVTDNHFVPFQRSTRGAGFPLVASAAKHVIPPMHATPPSTSPNPAWFAGPGTIVHLPAVPCWISGEEFVVCQVALPTAQQPLTRAHPMPASMSRFVPPRFAAGTFDHTAPFHCSASALVVDPFDAHPTARQSPTPGHTTAFSEFSGSD